MTTIPSIQELFRIVHDAIGKGRWWPVAGVILIFVVSALRKLAVGRMGKVGAWLATDHGAILLAFVTAAVGGVSLSLLGGATPTRATWVGALMAGATAAWAYPGVQKFFLSAFGIELGLTKDTKQAHVDIALNGKQRIMTPLPPPIPSAAAAQPVVLVPPTPPTPRKGRKKEEGFSNATVMFVLVISGIFVFAIAWAGCALNGYDVTRVSITGLNHAVVAGTSLSEAAIKKCADKVDAFTVAQKFTEAHIQQGLCEKLRTHLGVALLIGKDAAATARPLVDAAEAAGSRNWGAALVPVLQAGAKLVEAFGDLGIKLPKIQGVN